MIHIDSITEENIGQSLDLQDMLRGSVFYPACRIDGSAIEFLGLSYNSFIHVDFSTPEKEILGAMKRHFHPVGYDVTGPASIPQYMLEPRGFESLNWDFTDFERDRLRDHDNSRKYYESHIPYFARWSVYRLNPGRTGSTRGKSSSFSLLHICGEACRWFERLYLSNRINPSALAILSPGDGYGDNWTRFIDMEDRLYRLVAINAQYNGAEMPETLITDRTNEYKPLTWPGYEYVKTEPNLLVDPMRFRNVSFYRRVA